MTSLTADQVITIIEIERQLTLDAREKRHMRASLAFMRTSGLHVVETSVLDEYVALTDRLSEILTQTANALKGTPDELHRHDWSNLGDVAYLIKAERDALRAEVAELRGNASEEEA